MIEVLFTRFSTKLPDDLWHDCMHKMPQQLQEEINRLQRWRDRQAKLLGKMLLIEVLKKYGLLRADLDRLSYTSFGRPFLNYGIDFNISHSGGCVICAATDGECVGVDIEKIRSVELNDVRDTMTADEWTAIHQSDAPHDTFFAYWTQKESIIKADGRGLSVPLDKIYIQGDIGILYDKQWFLRELSIAPGYKCHLAASQKNADIVLCNIGVDSILS